MYCEYIYIYIYIAIAIDICDNCFPTTITVVIKYQYSNCSSKGV